MLLYRIGVRMYIAFIHLAAIFHHKAQLWVRGRKDWKNKLESKLKAVGKKNAPLFWVHCASLGEFEQGRPLIEALREAYPTHRILLSFFSPSGYELRKNYPLADIVCYLPSDSRSNATTWLNLIQPTAVFFIKYEFWYDHLQTVSGRKIPLYLVSASFRKSQPFFRPWGHFFRKMLFFFDKIFVQTEDSRQLLSNIGINDVVVSGDTRVDRVLAIKEAAKAFPLIDKFVKGAPVLVCGSTWAADEVVLGAFIKDLCQQGWKIIIAPHEVYPKHIEGLRERLKINPQLISRYSSLHASHTENTSVLVIDNIGMLSALYRYARVAYVGGGFGKGIHNILEAAVYEIPVLFGPKCKKFVEAQDLLTLEVAFVVSDSSDLRKVMDKIDFEAVKACAHRYLEMQKGATQCIIECLAKVK